MLSLPLRGSVPIGSACDPYSWSLLGTHAVVWLFFAQTDILTGLTAAIEPYCWPYFETCWQWRLRTKADATVVQLGYLVVGLFAGGALWHQSRRALWCGLLALNLFLFAVTSLDYRLRANEFYMLFWVNGVFLLWPQRRWAVPVAIISCYFWAGVLKLNVEWLSGAGLYQDLWWIPKTWTPAACAYVVALEMAMIWGLLANRLWIRVAVLAQLVLFHVQSLSQIHWFYPLLMAVILSWFVIDRTTGTTERRPDLRRFFSGGAPISTYVLVAFFGAMQLAPHAFDGDSTLTGQGRVFALHMFQARQQCSVSATVTSNGEVRERIDLKVAGLPPRTICDPVVYFSRAKNLCRARQADDPGFDFRLVMDAKRTSDPEFQRIIDAPTFCAAGHEFRLFANNDWIR